LLVAAAPDTAKIVLVMGALVRYNARPASFVYNQRLGLAESRELMAVTAPPTERPPVSTVPIALAEPRRWSLTYEQALYLLIGVFSVLSHLYLLGDRAFHHDETLHAAYSWRIYQGQGYLHDPLLHGPFLYYLTALHYFLFGDSDFTARLGAALFGIVLTLLPWLLRRDLGRGTALIASIYLLISPVVLYVGRFIRHDIFAVVFELLSVIAILRYIATERPVWHYTLAAAMGLMLTTMETFYLFLAIVGSFVAVWIVFQVGRQLFWLLLAYVAVAGVALKLVPRLAGPIPLPTPEQALLVRHQPDNNLIIYARNVATTIGPMLLHPAMLLLLLSTALFLGTALTLIFFKHGSDGRSAWRRIADTAPRGTLIGALDRIPARQWAIAFGIAFVIYALQYTAFLSNPLTPNIAGLITGVSGSFLYWLGQHEVQRGGQPPHYYLFQLSVYEPLLLLFGPLGLVLIARRLLRLRRPQPNDEQPTRDRRWSAERLLFAPALLAWWSLGALAIYSWAGEKMPWLTIHVALPLALLSAWTLSRIWSWAARGGFDGLALALTGMTGVLLLLAFNQFTSLARDAAAVRLAAAWPALALIFVALLVAGMFALYRSLRPALLAVLSLTLAFGLFFTLRSSIRLAYVNGDVPVEPMVFVQTAPDVTRALEQLRAASLLRTGRLDLPIRFDNETIWDWYLRNYRETEGSRGTQISSIDDEVQAVFMLSENVPANEANLNGFVRQEYPLRWWFPECEVYRFPASDSYCGNNPQASSLLSRVLSRPWDGKALADYWQFWFNRRLPAPLGSTNWTLFVRPEVAAEFGVGAGAEP
jgi:4-amino-4-deoxy-L-arabinose transferase-like glycosyltransferase